MTNCKGPAFSWLTPPVVFFALLGALLTTWAVMEPAALVHFFDQGGYSPFELATIPVFAAIIPFVWWKCPFAGSRTRRTVLCLMVSVVVVMAILKELDLHLQVLRSMYPDILDESGSIRHGLFFKPDGRPLTGTPFKMRVLTNGAIPLMMKAWIVFYFGAFFGTFAAGFAYFGIPWIRGVLKLEAPAWSWGCFGGSGVVVQISDRLPAWLDHAFGLDKHAAEGITKATSLCTCLEEGGEMMIAIFALLTIYLGYRAVRAAEEAPSAR